MYQYKMNFMKKLKSKGNTAQQRFATLLHNAKKTCYMLKLTTWRGSQIVASYIVGRSGIKKAPDSIYRVFEQVAHKKETARVPKYVEASVGYFKQT